jgi:hypothetical protein
MSWRMLIVVVVCSLLAGGSAFAQSAAGQVNGSVTDPTGAAVVDVNVTLQNRATGIETKVLTNANGYYTFLNVKPGPYTLRLEQKGFRTVQVPEFVVAVNQTITRDVALTLGQVAESVEVRAAAEMVQQASAELGTVVSETAVHDLPLNGRNFTQLLTLTPGATPVSTSQGAVLATDDGGTVGIPGSSFSNPSLQGQFNRSVIYFLDGIVNTDLRTTTYTIMPNIDLIEEFKVQSHNDKVEYGGVTGGVVNVVSKAGTNQFHGSAYEFVRNDAFDARDPFVDVANKSPAPFRQNQFGATATGPILKNRTFFSGGYEGWRYRKPTQALARVPTDAELAGDFSNSIIQHNLYNPFSTRTDAAGNLVRDVFPNNVIPPNLVSPMTQGFLQAYSERPNYTADPFYNFIVNQPLRNDSNSWQVRGDHTLRAADSLFFRFSQMRVNSFTPLGLKSASTVDMVANNYGGGWTHLFGPHLLLDFRGGTAYRDFVLGNFSTVGLDPMKKLGFADVDRFGGLTMSLLQPWNNAGGLGGSVGVSGPAPRGNPIWNLSSNLSWLKGAHNLKTGFQFIHVARLQINQVQTYSFDNNVTADPQNLGPTGASLASALLALPVTFSGILPGQGDVRFSMEEWAAYVQDEWKIRPNITINLGLRFDRTTRPAFETGFTAGPDLATGDWLIGLKTLPPPCNQQQQAPCIPGNGIQDVPYNQHIKLAEPGFVPAPTWDNWGPRASIAWRFGSNWVLRGGYGLYFDPLPSMTQVAQNNSEVKWPNSSGFSGAANGLGSPPTLLKDIQGNFPSVLPEASPWNSSGWFNDPDRKDAYSHQWNVELQRQITDNLMVSAAYVGSVNRRLEYSGLGNMAQTPGPGSPDQVKQRRPMPYMWGGFFYSESIGRANYNSLQLKAQRRFSQGLQMLLSYTWSKSIDTGSSGWFDAENGPGGFSAVQDFYHPDSNRSVSAYNIPHFLSWSTLYELPAGKGKRWLQSGPASWILGNWQLNSILQARSGQPYNLSVTGDVANIGNDVAWFNYARPNLVGDPTPSHPTSSQWYNPAAFSVPQFTYGSFGRNVLSSDHVVGVDLSLFKAIPLGESRQLELRFEGFNTFNIINQGVPGTTVDQGDAGRVTSVAAPPRQLQFALKFLF